MFAKMSKISKLLGFRKDTTGSSSEGDTESQSSYDTVPEDFSSDKDSYKASDKDVNFASDSANYGDRISSDSSSGLSFCVGSDNSEESDQPLREVSNVIEQIVEERHSFVPSNKTLKHVSSKEHLTYLGTDAQLDFVGSELLKQFDLSAPDTGGLEPSNHKQSIAITDIDDVNNEKSDKTSRTERSSGSDDTLQYLESDPQLGFLQSELLQRLQLVRMDSSKSDSDDNEEKPNYERSRSDQLERIVEEEVDDSDKNKDIIQEILQLEKSETVKSDLVEAKSVLEYPKVESIKVCAAITEKADERNKSLSISGDSDSSLLINHGLSDDEEYHRILAMADLSPEDNGSLANLVPGSDIEESEDSLTFIADSFCGEVKTHPQHSKRQLHI